MISYTVVGGIVGGLGSAIGFTRAAQGIMVLVAGAFMDIMGLNMLDLFPWLRKLTPRIPRALRRAVGGTGAHSGRGPLVVGLLNGLMPCGPLQSMQIYALGTGSVAAGALSMFLFSLGTVPLMLGFGALANLLSGRLQARVLKVGALLVVFLGMGVFARGLNVSGVRPLFQGSASSIATIRNGLQLVETTMSSSRYEPILVQAGVPVRWTIHASADSLNGCNNPLTVPSYGIELLMVPGDNVLEFTPPAEGDILYTCWMGMISSTIRVVSDVASATERDLTAAVPPAAASAGTPGGGGSCCAGGAGTGSSLVLSGPIRIPTEHIVMGSIVSGTQRISMDVRGDGFSPAILVMQRGLETIWEFRSVELTEANYRIEFPEYQARMELDPKGGEVRVIPQQDFIVASWKGDFHAYVKVVDDLEAVDQEALRREVRAFCDASTTANAAAAR